MRIFLIGFMGSGKSYSGQQLAELLKCPFIDLDNWIEEKAGKSIPEIFAESGEGAFRTLEQKALQAMLDFPNAVVATGGGTPCFFDNIQWMNENGLTIYLKTAEAVLLARLKSGREHRPLLRALDDTQLLEYIRSKVSERSRFYEKAWVVYHQKTADEQVAQQLARELSNIIGH